MGAFWIFFCQNEKNGSQSPVTEAPAVALRSANGRGQAMVLIRLIMSTFAAYVLLCIERKLPTG